MKGPRNKIIYPIAYARNRICIYRGYLCVAGPKKQQELKNKRIYGPSEWIPCGQHLFLIHYSKLHIIIIIDGFSIIIFFFLFLFSNIQKKKKKKKKYIFRICFFCVFVFSKENFFLLFGREIFVFLFPSTFFLYIMQQREKKTNEQQKVDTHNNNS